MNEVEKTNWFCIGSIIIVLVITFILGFFTGRGGDSAKIADAQATVESLTTTVTGLNKTVELAEDEIKRLGRLRETDRTRIAELEQLNNEITKSYNRTARLLEKQRDIIREITAGDRLAEESSVGITEGLGKAINTIDSLIKDIQGSED